MRKFTLKVLIMSWEQLPVVKTFEVMANSFSMAAGICKGQAAVNGWKIIEVIDYQV